MSEILKIDPYGFREYDARWLYEKDINKLGITNLGKGLGTQIIKHTKNNNPRIIVGHDYRSYSEEIKSALKLNKAFKFLNNSKRYSYIFFSRDLISLAESLLLVYRINAPTPDTRNIKRKRIIIYEINVSLKITCNFFFIK